MKDKFTEIFDQIFDKALGNLAEQAGLSTYPKVNVITGVDKMEIFLEIPGFEKHDITVKSLPDNVIEVKGERKIANRGLFFFKKDFDEKDKFEKKFKLGDKYEIITTSGECNAGILKLTIKTKTTSSTEIKIN